MAFFSQLIHTVTVESLTTAQDGSGGTTEAYATRRANVPCLLSQESGATDRRFDSEPRTQAHTVLMLYLGTQPGDRVLVVTGPSNVQGKYLTVDGVTNHGGIGTIEPFCRLSCTQVLP